MAALYNSKKDFVTYPQIKKKIQDIKDSMGSSWDMRFTVEVNVHTDNYTLELSEDEYYEYLEKSMELLK